MDYAYVTRFARLAPRLPSKVGLVFTFFTSLSLAGCGDDGAGPANQGNRGNVLLVDANNYSTESSLTIPTVETASAVDLDICWSDAVTDLQCHELDPLADIDNMSLLRFSHLTQAQVAEKLTSGQLPQSEVDGYLDYNTDHGSTCAKLSSVTLFGTKIDVTEEYAETADRIYMLILSKGTVPGVGARTMTFLKPSAASTNTKVFAPSGCGMLDFSADLRSATTVSVSPQGPWLVDWADVTRDGQGNPIADESIDGLMIGFFEDKSVADIEAGIFDIERTATTLWDIPLGGGRKADLAAARDRASQEPFAGFDRTDGVWLLALLCSKCQNPQPVVLSVLEPSTGSP